MDSDQGGSDDGVPEVPRVGAQRVPSVGGYEIALANDRATKLQGLSRGKREKSITVRFTEAEFRLIEACSDHAMMTELATFVRLKCLERLRELYP